MTYRSGVLTGIAASTLVAGAGVAGWWMLAKPTSGSAKAGHPIPAVVDKPFKEGQSTEVKLTPEADARLAIETAEVVRRPAPRVRVYGGEVTIPQDHIVVVSAPLAGLLKPAGDAPLTAGRTVRQGEPLYELLPILDPVGRANLIAAKVDAEGQVENAQKQVDVTKIALDRAERVLTGGAGSQRMVDEAQAQVDIATKALDAATARSDLMSRVVGNIEGGTTTPVPVTAPEDGILRTVSALANQTVPAGAVLFEVIDLSTVWVRVPVYVGDLRDLDSTAPAAVGPLTARPGDPTRPADPVAAPPTANPAVGTADLFYALDNREAQYRPGQRVGATLPLTGPADSLVVPTSAVVYDIHGGGWVYEKTGSQTYARRRVVVRYVTGNDAVLASGPPPGTPVVTAGSAELFGTETGFSK